MPELKPSLRKRVSRATARSRTGPKATEGAGRRGHAARITRNRFFRDLVQSMRNGVLAITRDGRVALMNDVAYRILNVRPGSSDIGRSYAEVLRNHQDVIRILSGAFELSHLPNRAELRLKTSGKVIGYTLSQIADGAGRVLGATLFFKDLTRVEQLEERERLRDRLAALGEMAAAIAHEVKNPLAGIEVMAGVLKRHLQDSTDAQAILNDIIKEAKMANAIVLEVLDFVRPLRLQVERVSVSQVLDEAIRVAESQVQRGDVAVEIDAREDLPRIQGDPHQLRQVFTNLLINAFEALGGRGNVQIGAYQVVGEEDHGPSGEPPQSTPMVIVDVADDGPGVTTDDKDRIFSPFFTTKPRGSGLGLAIVRKIVDAHDGRIDLATRPEGGTRFRVALPVTGAHDWYGK